MTPAGIAERHRTEPDLVNGSERSAITLHLPNTIALAISPVDFEALCQHNGDLRLERTGQGELIAMSPAGSKAGWREVKIVTRLEVWSEHDQTGLVFGSNAGFTLPNGAVRAPDASWIKLERWNALTAEQQETFAPIVPDFVAELCSPSDSRPITRAKMAEYLEQGVRLGWMIDPKTKTVEIYRAGRDVEVLVNPAQLSGEDLLPGFVFETAAIFAEI